MEIDGKIELKYLEEKLVKIQKEILEIENEALPESKRIMDSLTETLSRKKKQLEEFKVRKIRLVAEMEEASK